MVLEILNADQSHSRDIWEWRNHATTRSVSREKDEIEWDDHKAWFKESLENNKIFLYIGINKAFQKDIPIGIIRFNLVDFSQKHYEVSINIAPNARNRGFGYCLLKYGTNKFIEDVDKCIRLYAVVKVGNLPSMKLFTSAGYSLLDSNNNGFARYFFDFK
tara:strand:+ start:313 stop:792 length:480 start_codon:yes stop_codon:yes gene_type:complete